VSDRLWRARAVAAGLAAALLSAGACDEPAAVVDDATPPRAGRFGSLRDLVLFERPGLPAAQALFFDRFEATRSDWAAFAATAAGRAVAADAVLAVGDPSLPIAAIDLVQARAFAHWRFLRLPRSDEWWFAAVGGRGGNHFPWGRREDTARANTLELGLGKPTPVGTFESGRRTGGDQPYDWIGNVSEWTETVPAWWSEWRPADGTAPGVLDPVSGYAACRRVVQATPALAAWEGPGGLMPLAWLHAAGGAYVPREVLGSDYQSPLAATTSALPAGDRVARTGVRLCATVRELLAALVVDPEAPTAADVLQLERFVRRGRHRDVLREAWPDALPPNGAHGPLFVVLRRELGLGGG